MKRLRVENEFMFISITVNGPGSGTICHLYITFIECHHKTKTNLIAFIQSVNELNEFVQWSNAFNELQNLNEIPMKPNETLNLRNRMWKKNKIIILKQDWHRRSDTVNS